MQEENSPDIEAVREVALLSRLVFSRKGVTRECVKGVREAQSFRGEGKWVVCWVENLSGHNTPDSEVGRSVNAHFKSICC